MIAEERKNAMQIEMIEKQLTDANSRNLPRKEIQKIEKKLERAKMQEQRLQYQRHVWEQKEVKRAEENEIAEERRQKQIEIDSQEAYKVEKEKAKKEALYNEWHNRVKIVTEKTLSVPQTSNVEKEALSLIAQKKLTKFSELKKRFNLLTGEVDSLMPIIERSAISCEGNIVYLDET